jgi:adenylate cyclase
MASAKGEAGAERRRWGLNSRRIRLVSGLVLFTYVTLHLMNHSLGNISLDAMEAGVIVMKAIWQSAAGTILLYAALLAHMALGFRALYERRMFRFRRIEVPQLVLGLLIPIVLINHISATRIAFAVNGFAKGYAQELFSFWVASPLLLGIGQTALLIVAWIHGCIGIYFWLRLKRFFRPLALVLLAGAVMLPTLALLGFYQGGRAVAELATHPAWRDANVTPAETGTLEEQQRQFLIRNLLLWTYIGGIACIFAARAVRSLREQSRGIVRLTYPERRTIEVPRGLSLLDASTRYDMPHASVCGGKGRCGTCLVTILAGRENCPPPGVIEAEMLNRMRVTPRSALRLGCQLRPTGDVTFVPMLPPHASTDYAFGGRRTVKHGKVRTIVCMMVEMRDVAVYETGGGGLDLLFLTNRFLSTAAASASEAGGLPNRFYGNGMMALFGLETAPAVACRQALEAAAMTAVSLDHLNSLLAPDLREPLRFVVSLHVGDAVLGEVGVRDELAFSAVGGMVRDASALLDLARATGYEVMASEDVCRAAGLASGVLQSEIVTLPGQDRRMAVRLAKDAVQIFGALDSIVDDATTTSDPPGDARLQSA